MKIHSELLKKFINGNCNSEEKELVSNYLQGQELSQLEALLQADWDSPVEAGQYDTIKEEVWQQLSQNQPWQKAKTISIKSRSSKKIMGMAASFLILLSLGLSLLWYWPNNGQSVVNITNTQLTVQEIALADGSKVWLTPGSQIEFPKAFDDNQREVVVTGEVFFDVAPDQNRPFITQTNSISIKVLGTSFNVRSFPFRDYVEVALIEGKVTIHQDDLSVPLDSLRPGQKIRYSKSDSEYKKDSIAQYGLYQWKQGLIQFEGASITEVAEILENWYGIVVTIEQPLKRDEQLVHRIDTRKMSIEEVITGINLVAKYHYYEQVNATTYLVRSK